MPDPRKFWEEVYRRFDPEEPTDRHAWRATRPDSPRTTIVDALKLPFKDARFLFMGTMGTGKTTELLAIAEDLVRTHNVVYLDLWRHFEERVGDPAALQRIQPWEILVLIGLAVYRGGAERFSHRWDNESVHHLESAVKQLAGTAGTASAKLNLAKAAGTVASFAGGPIGGVVEAGLSALGGVLGAADWELPLGERDRRPLSERDQRIRQLLDAVNRMIDELQRAYNYRLIVLVDGLDRVEDLATTRALFTESILLGSLTCPTIVTGPLVLRHKGLAAQVRRFEAKILANAPVLAHDDPRRPDARGVDFLCEVFRLRTRDLAPPHPDVRSEDAITRPDLERFAYYSGGRLRDFIRFVRMAAEQAWETATIPLDPAIVERCLDERRRLIELGLTRADVDVLQAVLKDPQRLLPDSDRVAKLLEQWCLLPYPNESEWYHPHPLLMMHLLAPTG